MVLLSFTVCIAAPKLNNTIEQRALYCKGLAPTKTVCISFGPEVENGWRPLV